MQTLDRVRGPEIIVKRAWVPEDLEARLRLYEPRTRMGERVLAICRDERLSLDERLELFDELCGILVVRVTLAALIKRGRDGVPYSNLPEHYIGGWRAERELRDLIEDYGIVREDHVVTNTGVNFIVGALCGTATMSNLHFHALGTGGGTGELATQTALVTELTTEYTGNARASGTQVDNTATPHTFTTVATNTLDSGTPSVNEHGIMDQSATGGGTMLDRSAGFGPYSLNGANGDGLQTTYTFSPAAGG
jgi:hypothetical protein